MSPASHPIPSHLTGFAMQGIGTWTWPGGQAAHATWLRPWRNCFDPLTIFDPYDSWKTAEANVYQAVLNSIGCLVLADVITVYDSLWMYNDVCVYIWWWFNELDGFEWVISWFGFDMFWPLYLDDRGEPRKRRHMIPHWNEHLCFFFGVRNFWSHVHFSTSGSCVHVWGWNC